jgi:NAD(P)-dependent dehydrogenase (short-subunit alcohol dehydrogenase family)
MAYKVWLITGASKGLGYELAKALLQSGQRVVATARDPAALQSLAAYAQDTTPADASSSTSATTLATLALDVTDAVAIAHALAEAMRRFGRLDVVVNNAGYAVLGEAEGQSAAQVRSQVEVDLLAPIAVTQQALALFRGQRRGGTIIQVTTVGAFIPSPGLSIYQASKAGLEHFLDVVRGELDPAWNINLLSVRPGGFRTEWGGSSMIHTEPVPGYEKTMAQHRGRFEEGFKTTAINDPVKFGELLVGFNSQALEYESAAAEGETVNGWGRVICEVCPNEQGTGVGGIILGPEAYAMARAKFQRFAAGLPKQKQLARVTVAEGVDVEASMDRLEKAYGKMDR